MTEKKRKWFLGLVFLGFIISWANWKYNSPSSSSLSEMEKKYFTITPEPEKDLDDSFSSTPPLTSSITETAIPPEGIETFASSQGLKRGERTIGKIMVTTPLEGKNITFPLQIKGEANVYEGTVFINLLDSQGHLLAEEMVLAGMGKEGELFPFQTKITPPEKLKSGENIHLELFWRNARDGSKEGLVKINLEVD